MIKTFRLTALSAALALTTVGLTTAATQPAYAASCSSGVPGDVNGDGHAEVAVSEFGGEGKLSAVHVFYGRSSGLTTKKSGRALDDQYFDLDTPGVPDELTESRDFGQFTAFGDFNGDGCADLAASVLRNNSPNAVVVLYGSPSGLTTRGAQRFAATNLPLGPVELFGPLVSGDLDNDGIDDLAIGADGTKVSGHQDAGAVAVLYGDAAGLAQGSTAAELVTRDTPGVPGDATDEVYFGHHLTIGDFNGNGRAELAVSTDFPEAVQTIERGPNGYGAPQPDVITAATVGAAGGFGDEDFGRSLAAGDVDHDGRDDLAIGMASYTCPTGCDDRPGVGAVALVRGSGTGLTATGSQIWSLKSPGITDADHDRGFGQTLAMGRLDRDAYADLAVGTNYNGTVTVLHGGKTGLNIGRGSKATTFTPASVGVRKTVSFGQSLVVTPVQSRTQSSLVIGAYDAKVGKDGGTGAVVQLSLKGSGPTTKGRKTLTLGTRGVRGNPDGDDGFGFTLS